MTLKRHDGIRLLRMTNRASCRMESKADIRHTESLPACTSSTSQSSAHTHHTLFPLAFSCGHLVLNQLLLLHALHQEITARYSALSKAPSYLGPKHWGK